MVRKDPKIKCGISCYAMQIISGHTIHLNTTTLIRFYVYSLDAGQILKSVATRVSCVSRILLGHKLMAQDLGHNQFLNYTWLHGLEIHRS